ncbi:MAG: hypothetical protein IPM15_01670 [Betaproteobacteria bacterium]|nr:hypothetical protein [Betaproteobacteria bacterium]
MDTPLVDELLRVGLGGGVAVVAVQRLHDDALVCTPPAASTWSMYSFMP